MSLGKHTSRIKLLFSDLSGFIICQFDETLHVPLYGQDGGKVHRMDQEYHNTGVM